MTAASAITRKKRTRAAFIAALPGTSKEIAEAAKLAICTVQKLVIQLRAEGEIYIGEWRRAKMQGPVCPVHALGAGEDAALERLADLPREAQREHPKRVRAPRSSTAKPKKPAMSPEQKLELRRERRAAKAARAREQLQAREIAAISPVCLVDGAIRGQCRAFPLAGVWA